MTQIDSDPNKPSKEIVKLQISESNLDFQSVKERVKEKAREHCPDPMLLSWYHRTTGEFYPKLECSFGDRPAWMVFAEARGANLTVNVNDGEFIFLFLKLWYHQDPQWIANYLWSLEVLARKSFHEISAISSCKFIYKSSQRKSWKLLWKADRYPITDIHYTKALLSSFLTIPNSFRQFTIVLRT